MLETVQVLDGAEGTIQTVRSLFREYEAELGEDLCFQSFEEELASLPGKYAPPSGALLLGTVGGAVCGCVALRALAEEDGETAKRRNGETAHRPVPDSPSPLSECEMKRLYVRPAFRGHAYGRELAEEVIAEARRLGYSTMRLDTLARQVPALVMYRSLGFEITPPYYDNPIADAVYMALEL